MPAGPLVSIDPKDRTPIYAQLDRALRAAIATGRLQAGDQLPTVRQLAVALRINANTVAKVYSHLERSGTLQTRRGVGTFVVEGSASASSQNQEARVAELRAIATRALTDASAHGFSVADLRRELLTFTKGGTS